MIQGNIMSPACDSHSSVLESIVKTPYACLLHHFMWNTNDTSCISDDQSTLTLPYHVHFVSSLWGCDCWWSTGIKIILFCRRWNSAAHFLLLTYEGAYLSNVFTVSLLAHVYANSEWWHRIHFRSSFDVQRIHLQDPEETQKAHIDFRLVHSTCL